MVVRVRDEELMEGTVLVHLHGRRPDSISTVIVLQM